MGQPTKNEKSPEAEWLDQLKNFYDHEFGPDYWRLLEANLAIWPGLVDAGPFWKGASGKLDQWKTEYRALHGSHLLSQASLPSFVAKSIPSIKEKLFRNYTLNTESLKDSISQGMPYLPNIKDMLRTRVVCTYIDGVEFITAKLLEFAKLHGLSATRERQGKLEGYFAQHLIVKQSLIYQVAGVPTIVTVDCEIQVATEMSTKMWEVSHLFYEKNRRRGIEAEQWQWNPNDPQFISHQLGHMIHLVDGLLVQLRDSKKER